MIKIIGAVFVIAACGGFGFLKAKDLQNRITALQDIRRMFIHLRGEISYARNPFMEAFENMSGKEPEELSSFCSYMAEQISTPDGKSFYEKWCVGIDRHMLKMGIADEDVINLKKMGEQLGYLDYEMQLATIDLEKEQLENKINSLKQDIIQKKKVYRCVGIFFGLLLTIIFI